MPRYRPDLLPVARVPWEEHEDYLSESWAEGEHCSIFAPTEGGKTHLIRWGLLEPLWKRYPVLYLDLKPRVRTAAGMGKVVREFPSLLRRAPYRLRPLDSPRWDDDPQWFRLRPPSYAWHEDGRRADASWARSRGVVGHAIDRCYREGGWCLVMDDIQSVTDPRPPSLGLGAPMVNAWRNGREQPLTIIAATQQPAGAPSQMYDQPRHLYFGRTGDSRRHYRLGEIGGDVELIEATLPQLREHEFLYVTQGGEVMQVVKAPPRGRGGA